MRFAPPFLALFLVSTASAFADKPPRNDGAPPGPIKKRGVPAGLCEEWWAAARSRKDRAGAAPRALMSHSTPAVTIAHGS